MGHIFISALIMSLQNMLVTEIISTINYKKNYYLYEMSIKLKYYYRKNLTDTNVEVDHTFI